MADGTDMSFLDNEDDVLFEDDDEVSRAYQKLRKYRKTYSSIRLLLEQKNFSIAFSKTFSRAMTYPSGPPSPSHTTHSYHSAKECS